MKIRSPFSFLILLSVLGLFSATSCKKKTTTPSTTAYSVPTTYNGFTNVDYAEAKTIIGMVSELSTEIAKGAGVNPSTAPVPLDGQHLKNMLNNQGSPFLTDPAYNTSGYSILNNCAASTHAQLNAFIDTLVAVSNSGTTAANGTAGVGLTLDATPKRYLLTANGVNYSQLVFKNLMCDLFLNQITQRVADNTLDNTTNVAGKNYTAMEHSWDMAFGFWGVPDSFPTITTGLKYWGSYSNQINAGLGCNAVMMNAFLKGRAAISNHDMATKNAQAAIIIAELDKMTAGGVAQELNEIKQSITAGDQVKIVSQLSELRAFVMSMKDNENSGRIISDMQVDELLALIPANHWNVTPTDLDAINNYIASVYGFSAYQMTIL